MGLSNENAYRLIFDVETAPLETAREYLIDPIEAPSNYKDPVKIAAYIEEKKAKQFDDCSFDPDLCRVVAISVWTEEDSTPYVHHAGHESEAYMLKWFWAMALNHHLVGFNVLKFDLPVLLRRSLYLGVVAPLISVDKYRHPDVTDLQAVLTFNGATEWHSLDFYAKRFGCEVEDPMTGADIARAVDEERWTDIESHVLADVQKTAFVANKCGFFSQALTTVF